MMQEISRQLGLDFAPLKARDAVMKAPHYRRARWAQWTCAEASFDVGLETSLKNDSPVDNPEMMLKLFDDDDIDTVSTTECSEDDNSFSESSAGCDSHAPTVRFAVPPVTEIYERPFTTREERRELFYTNSEYREFRRDAFYSQCTVRFHEDVVTQVLEIPPPEDPSVLYYSESDLQG